MSITPEQAAEMQNRVLQLSKRAAEKVNEHFDLSKVNGIGVVSEIGVQKFMVVPKPRPTTKDQPEYKLQAAYVRKMNERHPDILVFSDCAAHIKKTKFQQMRANALSSPREKWPDVFVAQPSGDYAGLYLEFKAESPYYKNDPTALKKDEHNEAQAATMARLTSKGYLCYFVWSVDQAMAITENYLNQ